VYGHHKYVRSKTFYGRNVSFCRRRHCRNDAGEQPCYVLFLGAQQFTGDGQDYAARVVPRSDGRLLNRTRHTYLLGNGFSLSRTFYCCRSSAHHGFFSLSAGAWHDHPRNRNDTREIGSPRNAPHARTRTYSPVYRLRFPRRTETIAIVLPCHWSDGRWLNARARTHDRTFYIEHTSAVAVVIHLWVPGPLGYSSGEYVSRAKNRLLSLLLFEPRERESDRPGERESGKNHERATDGETRTRERELPE